jgi:nicotinate dehydrogenase subunit A
MRLARSWNSPLLYPQGHSRRSLTSGEEAGARVQEPVEFRVNGEQVAVALDPRTPLLDVLRNHLGLRRAHYGCALEQCGACAVLVDGEVVPSCTRPLGGLAGKSVTTAESLGTEQHPHPLQTALLDEQAGQCGYCLSGILISAKALLDRNPSPSRAEIAAALDWHLCRCGMHNRVLRAVSRAAAAMREGAA